MPIDWDGIGRESGVVIDSMKEIGEGWGSRGYLVNGQLVYKLAKKAGAVDEMLLEASVLRKLLGMLPIVTPRSIGVYPDSRAWPDGFAVQTFVSGRPIHEVENWDRQWLAERIGESLRILHTLSTDLPGNVQAPPTCLRNEANELLDEVLARIAAQRSTAYVRFLHREARRVLGHDAYFQYDGCLLHNDMHNGHLLIDGDVVAVIDWGDVCIGDPDRDFLMLYGEQGPDFAVDCARVYGHKEIDSLMAKLKDLDLLGLLSFVRHAEESGLPGEGEEAWRYLDAWVTQNGGPDTG